MSRFNTPAEVKEWARKAAANDYKKHQVIHVDESGQTWQVDKNPYCTPGARNDWRRGFLNAPPRSYDRPDFNDWDKHYQRGRAMAELIANMKQEPTA
jgi:hypothetical protein